MMFNPPNWISNRINTFPFNEKKVAVSTTIKPVTQLALMEVNRASINDIPCLSALISGSINRELPIMISTTKDRMNSIGGEIFQMVLREVALPNSIPTINNNHT